MYSITTLISLAMAFGTAMSASIPLASRQSPPEHLSGTYTFITPVPWCSPPVANEEVVVFSVSYKGHFSNVEDNGVISYKGHYTEHGTGISATTGNKFVLQEVDTTDETYTFEPPYNEVFHSETHFHITEQGSGQVFDMRANVEYTYDETNGLVYKFDNVDNSC